MAKPKKVDIETKKPLESGVYITRRDDKEKVMGFVGDYEAQLTPTGDVVIVELVPDLENNNEGKPTSKVRRFIAEGTWDDVVVV